MTLTLYSTEGCHLCIDALNLYQAVGNTTALQIVDIAFDDALFVCYGVTIPVISLQNEEGSVINELNWPFNFSVLKTWLNKHGID